jgi:hypothetical protein
MPRESFWRFQANYECGRPVVSDIDPLRKESICTGFEKDARIADVFC